MANAMALDQSQLPQPARVRRIVARLVDLPLSASEATALWRYRNLFITIIIVITRRVSSLLLDHGIHCQHCVW